MKKVLIMLTIAMISNTSSANNAFEDLQATTHKKEEPSTTFLEAATLLEASEDRNSALKYLEEYDQNITDNVTPSQVSSAEAMFKEVLGALLVRYISLREVARSYFKEFKDMLTKWYYNTIKS